MGPFFNVDAIDFFKSRLKKRKYRRGNSQDEADGAQIRADIFKPSNVWAHAVAKELPEYAVLEDNGWQQSGYFKEYAWSRLYLKELGDKCVYFRVGVDGGGWLTYNIDCYWKGLNKGETKRIREALDSAGPEDQPVRVRDFPEYNWPRLVAETVDFIKKHDKFYRSLYTLLDSHMEAKKKGNAAAFAAFAAKFPNPNIILYGPPGTGKTHHTLELAYELLTGEPPATYADAQLLFQKELGKRVEFVTFHQRFGYEDFVQGFKPDVDDKGQLVFKLKNGIFYEIARRARDEFNQQEQPDRPGRVPFDVVFDRLVQPLTENDEEVIVKITLPYDFF